jgi:hypothetical protein
MTLTLAMYWTARTPCSICSISRMAAKACKPTTAQRVVQWAHAAACGCCRSAGEWVDCRNVLLLCQACYCCTWVRLEVLGVLGAVLQCQRGTKLSSKRCCQLALLL